MGGGKIVKETAGNRQGAGDVSTQREPARGGSAVSLALWLPTVGPLLILALLVAAISQPTPDFPEPVDVDDILVQTAVIAIVAIGQQLAILMRGIDLSVGANLALATVIGGLVFRNHESALLVRLAMVASVMFVGAINRVVFVYGRLPHLFIITLATRSICRGLALELAVGHTSMRGMPDWNSILGGSDTFGVPNSFFVVLPVAPAGLVMTKGVQGIATTPVEPTVATTLDKAVAKGVKVVLMGNRIPNWKGQTALATTNNFEAGRIAGAYLKSLLKEGDTLGVLEGSPGVPALDDRVNGMLEGLKGVNVKIVGKGETDCQEEKGINVTQNLLIANPHLVSIYSACGPPAAGASVSVLDGNGERTSAAQSIAGTGAISSDDSPANAVNRVTYGEGVNVVLDATGNQQAMQAGFDYVAHGGRYALVGVITGSVAFADPDFHREEMTLFGIRNATSEDFDNVIAAIQDGHVPVDRVIAHRTSLSGAIEDIPRWARDKSGLIKALIHVG